MAATILTLEDLEQFKNELLVEIKSLLSDTQKPEKKTEKVYLKTHQVQRLLGISPGTLQNLRINGTIPYTKVGGVLFYDKEEIYKVLEQNMRNKFDHGK
jgi:hypothetical protein